MPLDRATIQKNYRNRKKAKEGNSEAKSFLSLTITEFFTKITGLIPTAKQVEVLQGLENPELTNVLISAGRQTGKSLCCAVAAIYLTLKNKIQVCLVSAKENYVYQHITDIFSTNPELRQYVSWEGVANIIPKDGYSLKNGSKVQLLSSSEKGIRGASASILFLDEAELMPSETLSTAYGNLSGKKIKLVVLGTPSSRYSKFNEILKNPKKYNFTLFKWSEIDCDWHSQEELSNKKTIMTEDEWKRDVLGEISESSIKLLWDTEQINKAIREQVLSEGGIRWAGVDGGGTGHTDRDKLALTIGEKNGKYKLKVLFRKTWGFEQINGAVAEIAEFLKSYKVQLVKVDSLPIMWSDLISEAYGKSKVFSVNSRYYKEVMQGQLSHTIESQGLEIPAEYDDLIQEMKSYKKQGNPHYDDLVDSLLLLNFWDEQLFPIKPATGGRVTIADLNTGKVWSNFGKNPDSKITTNLGKPFIATNQTQQKTGLFSRAKR